MSLGIDVPDVLHGASCREFNPDDKQARAMVRCLRRRFGVSTCAALLAVPAWLVGDWITGRNGFWPKDKRLIWLVYSLVFQPGKLRSPFDIITCGRFVGPVKRGRRKFHP